MWDTAYVYGMGSSETELGKRAREHPKSSFIASTKLTPQIADEKAADPVAAMLEGSLQRLGVDAIDIYRIHNFHDVERWTPGSFRFCKAAKSNAWAHPITIWRKSGAPMTSLAPPVSKSAPCKTISACLAVIRNKAACLITAGKQGFAATAKTHRRER